MLIFTDTPESLFVRLGRLGKVIADTSAYQQTLFVDLINEDSGIVPQYNNEPDIQSIVGGSYIGTVDAPGSVGGLMQSVAVQTINRQVFRDTPLYNLTLTQNNTPAAIVEVIRQMEQQGATILAMTITATPVPFDSTVANTGNGVVAVSVRRPVDGRVLENSFTESVSVLCTADSYIGGTAAGNKGFTIAGVGAQPDFFAFNWPLGSDGLTTTNAIDGSVDNGSGNYLVNSGWDAWTGLFPDNWEIVVGTAGVDILQETGNLFGGTSALAIVGDGSTLVTFKQNFNDDDGTTSVLSPLTQYACNLWIRRDGVIPSQGVLEVELVDGGGVVINDQGGNPCSFSIDLTQLTVFYVGYNGAFRLPEIMPSEYALQFRLSTALEAGRQVYLDLCGFGNMVQLYTSGPFFAVFAGSVPFVEGDLTTVAVDNSFGADGTQNTWCVLLNKLFLCQQNDILFPSSPTPTISDELISR